MFIGKTPPPLQDTPISPELSTELFNRNLQLSLLTNTPDYEYYSDPLQHQALLVATVKLIASQHTYYDYWYERYINQKLLQDIPKRIENGKPHTKCQIDKRIKDINRAVKQSIQTQFPHLYRNWLQNIELL